MDPITPNETPIKKSGNGGIIATVIALLLIAGGAFAYFKNSSNSDQVATTPADTINTTADTTATQTPVVTSKYKDGTYTAEGDYQSPGGANSISVTLVLKGDIVTDATVVPLVAHKSESVEMQAQFIAGYKAQVIGKNLSTLNLTKVSGSSLTPKGFDDAVTKIKLQAQV